MHKVNGMQGQMGNVGRTFSELPRRNKDHHRRNENSSETLLSRLEYITIENAKEVKRLKII